MTETKQFSLLFRRRFGPYFLTQFLGATNDNLYRNALLILVAFQIAQTSNSSDLTNLAMGLFVLPFFLFSALAGQLADKYPRSAIVRTVKVFEIFIMIAAAFALHTGSVPALLTLLFLTGTLSSFFIPVKFGIIPQYLKETELIGGNGLVSTGTFVAILIGTIVAGGLLSTGPSGVSYLSATMIATAAAGILASLAMPNTQAIKPELRIHWEPLLETWRIFQFVRGNRTVFLSIVGISWFWFFGAIYLAQLPNYTRTTLGGNEQVATLLLAAFSLGIGLGALMCERLSGHKINIGLVPFGSIGLTVFGIDLFFAPDALNGTALIGAKEFMRYGSNTRVLFDVTMLGVFGGFYIVPLYANVQHSSLRGHLARNIAANNILNSLAMVIAAAVAILLLRFISIPDLLVWAAVVNAVVAAYIYYLVPEFVLHFIVWVMIHTIYRVRPERLDRIPEDGPAILVCNHVSFVDPLIIMGSVRRPLRFVMYYKIYDVPFLNFLFRTARAIPIAPRQENAELLDKAYDRIAAELEAGRLVCIFPEGRITRDGEIDTFQHGIERIVERTPVPVVPMALKGLWGSFFSRYAGKAFFTWPRKLWARIGLVAGDVMPAEMVSAPLLQAEVTALRGDAR